jgi:hypothetical protein
MVACDQPFEEVDQLEFRRLLEYIHMRPLHIPHRKSMSRRIMKMGDDMIQDVKSMIAVSIFVWCSFRSNVTHVEYRTWTAK